MIGSSGNSWSRYPGEQPELLAHTDPPWKGEVLFHRIGLAL